MRPMSDDPGRGEWPLIVFTIGVQAACATVLAATAAEWIGGDGAAAVAGPIGLSAFPLVAIATAASLAHLGRPLDAWKALWNVKRSRLSREVWLTGGFAASALVYGAAWVFAGTVGRVASGLVAAGLGLLAVGSSASIYTVPGKPVWQAGWVPASFLGATLLLAGSLAAWFATDAASLTLVRLMLASSILGGLVQVASTWRMRNRARRLAERESSYSTTDVESIAGGPVVVWLLAFHVLLVAIVPIGVSTWLVSAPNAGDGMMNLGVLLIGTSAPLVGTWCGRALMFRFGMALPRF